MNNTWIHFAYDFAEKGGYDAGQLTDLVTALAVTGKIDIIYDVNKLSFYIGGKPVVSMIIVSDCPGIYIIPDDLRQNFPSGPIENLLEYFRTYIDESRCHLPAYESPGAYFLDIQKILDHADEFSDVLDEFALQCDRSD